MRHDTYESMHEILRKIILENPEASEADAKERMWNSLQDDPDRYFRLLYDNWFNANWYKYEPEVKEIITERPGQTPIVGRSITVVRKIQRHSQERKEKRKIVAKKILAEKSGIILMNLPMPNGKLLRDCTGAECIRFGGWMADVGKALKPNQKVGARLTETDLHNLYGRNRGRAA